MKTIKTIAVFFLLSILYLIFWNAGLFIGNLVFPSIIPCSGLVLGLLFAVLMNSQLLLHNPYMSGIVRLAHAVETSSSNFIWGFIIAWMITPKQVVQKENIKILKAS